MPATLSCFICKQNLASKLIKTNDPFKAASGRKVSAPHKLHTEIDPGKMKLHNYGKICFINVIN